MNKMKPAVRYENDEELRAYRAAQARQMIINEINKKRAQEIANLLEMWSKPLQSSN